MAAILSYKQQPRQHYLVDNPIVFELQSTVQERIYFDITIAEQVVYSGVFIPVGSGAAFEATISIAEILKSYIKDSEISDMTIFVSPVSNSFFPFSVTFKQNSDTLTYNGNVFNGGIGKKLFRYLKERDTDIFDYKFLNPNNQFFLTTRTAGRHIVVKENELCPLYFIALDKSYVFVTEYGNKFFFTPPVIGEMYALNIRILRQLSHTTFGNLPSYIEVLVNDCSIFDVTIQEPAPSPTHYIIEFLNSFAAFERLEVTGKVDSEPEFAEDNVFMSYDRIIDDYTEQNNRLSMREIIHAAFGYKSPDEFLFMRDMLQSNKRYLIDPDGNRQEVRVSAENFSHAMFPTKPGSISLKIRMVDNDSNYSPAIDASDPDVYHGESIWQRGITSWNGFLYADSQLKTI